MPGVLQTYKLHTETPCSSLQRVTALELEDYGQALREVSRLTTLTSLRSVSRTLCR